MNDREALLRAVCENPDDDTPRLVFADWLEEHGEPERAEFIRVQIEAFVLGNAPIEQNRLLARDRDLLRIHERRWRAELPTRDGWEWGGFSRGFVERLQLTSQAVPLKGTEIADMFRSVPVTDLILCTHHRVSSFLPYLKNIRKLMLFAPDLTDEEIEMLCDTAYLPNLAECSIWLRPSWNNPTGVPRLIARFGKRLRIGN